MLALLPGVVGLGAPAARAQHATGALTSAPADNTALTPSEAHRLAETLQDPQKRSQLIDTLNALSKTAPASEKPAEADKAPPPPTPPPETEPAKPGTVSLAPDSLGAQLLAQASHWPALIAHEFAATGRTVTSAPLLWIWIRSIANDPEQRTAVVDAIWQSVLVAGGALLLGWLLRLAMRRPINALATHAPNGETTDGDTPIVRSRRATAWHLLKRLPFALMRLVLELIPVGVFWGSAMLMSAAVPAPLTRAVIAVVINGYAVARAVMAIARMLVSPALGRLRLLQTDDAGAEYLIAWLRAIVIVGVTGGVMANLALLFGLFEDAYDTLVRLVALIVAGLLAVLVLRCRTSVAQRLRAPPDAEGGIVRWRNCLAGSWHLLALLAIAAGWILAAAGIQEGLGGLRVLIGSVLIVVAARIVAIVLLGTLDRVARLSEGGESPAAASLRAARYQALAHLIVTIAVVLGTLLGLLEFWGFRTLYWFEQGRVGANLMSAAVTVTIAVIAAIVVWELANSAMERRLARLSAAGPASHSARLRTLLPILRAALLTTIVVIVGLTALSEIGVNIAPLLAGAGIVGVAVGFGSQKLVQDVITGMFVLFENAIQIGDSVTVASLSGNVERLSVRNIWLRGGDGAVHIIPFSAVTSITNSNRGLGNAAVSVTISVDEDADRAADVLRDIAAGMKTEDAYASAMLGDLGLWVDAVKASGVTLSGTISCTDSGRWSVQREFNRRVHKRFRELGIVFDEWPGKREITWQSAPTSA
ncbi:MAG: mechanosensitive ion channel [Alphaproteobacteria bacterium]|nr:mechanosensitive ion channel [Alphaproteobacteria bacterium]